MGQAAEAYSAEVYVFPCRCSLGGEVQMSKDYIRRSIPASMICNRSHRRSQSTTLFPEERIKKFLQTKEDFQMLIKAKR
ncbi:hypothetical protein NL676_030489 [Syzygium grande]|nr:hypothetical protein NL676_030489 [Syzygium grande]